jgi:uncharacterized protein YndB with AHSA1/START domain
MSATTIYSRLPIPVPPLAAAQAFSDPVPMARWFKRHAPSLGVVDAPQHWGLRGAYHFWSSLSPDPPPALQTTLLALRMPSDDDPGLYMRYLWNLRGARSELELELTPAGAGSLLHLAHHGLKPLEQDPLGGAAYWRIVLENLRLYLLGGDGLAFQCARSRGALELGLGLATPGLDATAAAWELLTTPAGLTRLWGDGAAVDPRVGGQLSYGWPAGGPGEIVTFEPPRLLEAGIEAARLGTTWQLAGDPLPTVMTWNLQGQGSATRLTIVHSGFGDGDPAQPYADTWRALLGQMNAALDPLPDWE